jgi:hypothetical protein
MRKTSKGASLNWLSIRSYREPLELDDLMSEAQVEALEG